MKYTLLAVALLFSIHISAQDQDAGLQSKIDILNSKIEQTEKGERLIWLDSLTKLTYRKSEFNYDSIVRRTVSLAISIDSLNLAAKRVADLMGFYNNYLGKPEEGLKLFNTHIKELSKETNFGAIGHLYLNVADSYYYLGAIDKSFEHYNIVKKYALKAKDQKLHAYAVMYIGYNESEIGKFAEASQHLKEAAQIFTKLKDTTNILGAKNALAILYSRNGFYKEADKERAESILLIGKTDRYIALTNLYYNAAEDNKKTKNYRQQLIHIKAAYAANAKTDNAFLMRPRILTQLIDAYCKNDSIGRAEAYFEDLNAIYLKDETEKHKKELVKARQVMAFAKGDYKNAIEHGTEFLTLLQNKKAHIGDIVTAEYYLSQAYKANGDSINYKNHLLNHYMLKDSITNIQNVKSLAYYQTLYETEKRDLEIKNQNANISVLNLQNKNKKQLLIFGSLGLLLLFGGVLIYRSFLSAKLRERAQHKFSQELIITQEQERTRIAKELHDSVGQQLTFLKMKTQNNNQTELSSLLGNTLEEVRSISRALYPVTLTKLGLTDSIEQLLLELDEETNLFVSIEIDDVNTNFDEIQSLNFYRFIQEALSNVLRHASAKTLIVNILKQSDGIKVLIKDNGCGFETNDKMNQNSLGIKTMAERINMLKGSLSIKSQKLAGTSLLVKIPIKND